MNKLEAIEIIEQNKIQVSRIVERNSEEEVIQNKIKLVDYVPLDIVVNTIDKIGLKRVVVPKYIADKIEYCKNEEGFGLFHTMDYCYNYEDSAEWLECNQETFARAWLDGYEVEQEKLYVVTDGNKLYLKEFNELNAIIIIDDVVGAIDYAKRYEDKTKAQQAADNLGWVVKEVE